MGRRLASAGTILATALAVNACCWLPPLLIAFGGTGGHFLSFLEPYRYHLLALAAIQLFFGFRHAYRKKHTCCSSGSAEHNIAHPRLNIGIMWGVAAFVILVNAYSLLSHDPNHDHEHDHAHEHTRQTRSLAASDH
jgi:hypothetical protein